MHLVMPVRRNYRFSSHLLHIKCAIAPSFYGLLGGNLSLQEELFTAVIRATFLEGRIYVVESDGEIVTMCLVFRKPASLFGS